MSTSAIIASAIGVARNADARIMTARRRDLRRAALDIDGRSRHRDARGGFEREAHHDLLARGDAAEHAAGVIALEARRSELVAMLGAALLDGT